MVEDAVLTKLEIIDIILSIYTENPFNRALEYDIIPRFKTEDGRICPIGCALRDLEMYEGVMGGVFQAIQHYKTYYYPVGYNINLPPPGMFEDRYEGHCIKFWKDLQDFHDNNDFFDDYGLTAAGRIKLELLKINWVRFNEPQKRWLGA